MDKSGLMPLHFIVTGQEFGYFYYLSVLSALKTQNYSVVTIWTICDVSSPYLDLLKDKVQIRKVDCPSFSALAGKPDHFVKSHLKDYLNYKTLYEQGGLYLDLDTFSISDVTYLLGDKELVVPTDAERPEDFKYHYNGAILMGKKGSPLLLEALAECEKRLNQTEEFRWGMTGPILISEIVFKHEEDIFIPEFRECGGFAGHEITSIYKNDLNTELDPKVRVIHLFAGVSNKDGGLFNAINPQWVDNSNSLIARTIKSVLIEDEWNMKEIFLQEKKTKMSEEWMTASNWESMWWNAGSYFSEELKQVIYARKMGLEEFDNHGHSFSYKFNGESIIDLGGGPCSLLIRGVGYKSATVLDPCSYPGWVAQRYLSLGINYIVRKAEDLDVSQKYDIVLMYNVLQHTEDPELIVKNALSVCKELRIFEWVNVPKSAGHIHVLTEEKLNEWLGGVGKTEVLTGECGCRGTCYYGIFRGAHYGG